MDIHTIPFEGKTIVYRPLRRLAFVANDALVRYIEERLTGNTQTSMKVEAFLDDIGFWEPDPPPPMPWMPKERHRPTGAVLLLTSACNLRCTYCYARGGEDPGYRMSRTLARQVIDTAYENAKERGFEEFSLSLHGGGEPTLNWDVLESSVKYVRSKELSCHISMASNGVWSESQRNFIVENFDGLSISFDGVQEVQDSQRPRVNGKGSFSAVLKSIRALDAQGLRYGVRLTTIPESFERLPDSIEMLCAETSCQVMQVEPAYSGQRGTYEDPTAEQGAVFVDAFLSAFEVAARHGRTLFYSGARPWVISSSFCRAAEDALVVTPEGDVVTCFETHDRRHPWLSSFAIGHADTSGIQVSASRVADFANVQEDRRRECRECFCYWHCGGDCASRCLSSPNGRRGRCDVNRAITRELLAWYIAAGGGVWRGSSDRAMLPHQTQNM